MRKLLHEPLFHFLLLGAVLFGAYAVLNDGDDAAEAGVITIAEPDVDWLIAAWSRQWRRPPTETELRGLIDDRVREEVLYREAPAMGLDRDDQIVRRRLAQKMEFLAEDLALMERLRMAAVLPANCRQLAPTASYPAKGAVLERWTVECAGTIVGREISIAGLEGLLTDVLVRIEPLDGHSYSIRLRSRSPSFIIPAAPSTWDVARTYLALGAEHILSGIDHLLFVLALLLIVGSRWRTLFKTITAFTVAHSLTLAAATLGWVSVPEAPVEAVIALSIVFLAAELAHGQMGRPGLTQQWPWIVAFTFGLLHGLGFAGALAELGLPQNQIPLALFQFNVGVEVGQLLFVAAVLGLIWAGRRLRIPAPAWGWRVRAYGIGAVAAFWTIQREAAFW